MSEEGTAVLESTEEERTPGGLFSKTEFENLKAGITKAAGRDDVPREPEPAKASVPEPEETEAADEPSREPETETPEPVSPEPEVPSEPAEPAEKKADEESPAAEFDDTLLARAEQMGFSKQAAESFGTPDKLETALTVLDQRLIGMTRSQQPVVPQPPVQQAAPPVQTVQAPPAQQALDALTIDLDPEEHDPAIVEQFKKLHAHYEARAQQFEQAFVGLLTGARNTTAANEVRLVSQAIEGLGDEMKVLITPEIRAQIHPTAYALGSALSQSRLPVPGIPELVKRAAHSLLSEQLLTNKTKRATEELGAKLEKRASQRTTRPSQHHSEEPALTKKEAQEKRVESVAAFQRERGWR